MADDEHGEATKDHGSFRSENVVANARTTSVDVRSHRSERITTGTLCLRRCCKSALLLLSLFLGSREVVWKAFFPVCFTSVKISLFIEGQYPRQSDRGRWNKSRTIASIAQLWSRQRTCFHRHVRLGESANSRGSGQFQYEQSRFSLVLLSISTVAGETKSIPNEDHSFDTSSEFVSLRQQTTVRIRIVLRSVSKSFSGDLPLQSRNREAAVQGRASSNC